MSTGLFLTAVNTEIGKTTVGLLICDYFNQAQISYFPYKPIESGAESTLHDARAYHAVSQSKYELNEICPYPLKDPVAPTLAAEREGKVITLSDLQNQVKNRSQFILVEGAGGWYSPLCSDGFVSDLARMLGFPVLFVIKDELGAINQAVLTCKAILAEGLVPVAAILNFYKQGSLCENLKQLQKYLPCPVFPLSEKFEETEILRFYDFFGKVVYPACISSK